MSSLQSAKEYIQLYCNSNKRLNELDDNANAKRAEEWVKKYFS